MRSVIVSWSPFTIVSLVLLHLSFANADGGDDFSSNFATDIAPLLALFGENVAKQFMADSMGWTDNIVFAMAPLGIITAIVGAIRVSGRPKWLKSVIGRAREGRGTVEIELMSSTSENVCELWNGQSIVRVLGSSSVIELVLDPALKDEKHHGIFTFDEAIRSEIIQQKRTSKDSDVELLETEIFRKSPPNIALNVFSKRFSRHELIAVAIFGTMIQVAVVALAGLETYIHPWKSKFQKNGRRVDPYAFPLMAIGTSLLVLGMIMCSHIIEARSREAQWEPSDTQIASFAFFGKEGQALRKSVLDTTNDRETRVLLATILSLIGFVVQFSALRFLHWSITICQLTAIAIMTGLRAIVRRNLAEEPKFQSLPIGFELDWMAQRLNDCESWKVVSLKKRSSELGPQDPRLTTAVMNSRNRLRVISQWSGRYEKTAESLTIAIEALMNYTSKSAPLQEPKKWLSKIDFEWFITAEAERLKSHPGSTESTARSIIGNLVFKLKRRRLDDNLWSPWRAERNDMEAILGLWMLHINGLLEKNPHLQEQASVRILSPVSKIDDEFSLWLPPGLKYSTYSRETLLKWKKSRLLFEPVAEEEDDTKDLRAIILDTPADKICAQVIFSTFLSQIFEEWSSIEDIKIRHETRKVNSFRPMSQTVVDVAEILEESGLADTETAYGIIVSALQTRGILPKSTDSIGLLLLLRGIRQLEDQLLEEDQLREKDQLREEADEMALWLTHQVEMVSKSLRTEKAWKDAGSVYWDYYAACNKVYEIQYESLYGSPERVKDAARRMGRFEVMCPDFKEMMSEEWKIVRNDSWAYRSAFRNLEDKILPDISVHSITLWEAVNREDALCMAHLLEENSTRVDIRGPGSMTPLIQASMQGCDAIVGLLMSKKAAVDAKDGKGQTSLHHAVQNKHRNVVELLLLGIGDTLYDVDDIGQTAFSIALINRSTKIIEMLDFYDVNDIGRSCAWRGAIAKGNSDLLQQLMDQGLEPESFDEDGLTPLLCAAKHGQETVVRSLLAKDMDIEAKDFWGPTALILAAAEGYASMVELLLAKGVNAEVKDRGKRTALLAAAANGRRSIVELLLSKNVNIEAKDTDNNWTALIWAARNGHDYVVELLLINNANIEAKGQGGCTALIWAAMYGYPRVVEPLLAKNANIEAKDKNEDRTALIWAAWYEHTSVVELLLAKNADIEAKGHDGFTALIGAARKEYESVVELLLASHANIEAKDQNGCTALIGAATEDHASVVELLLASHADIEAKGQNGCTALIEAATKGHERVVKLLLANHANIEAKDQNDCTALIEAAMNNHTSVVELLLANHADIEAKAQNGGTALIEAATKGHKWVIELLLADGANVHAQDSSGKTAMFFAIEGNHWNVINLLKPAL